MTADDKLGPVLKNGMEEGVSYVMVTYKTWRQVIDAYPPTLNVDRQNAALDRHPIGDHEIVRHVEYFGCDGRTVSAPDYTLIDQRSGASCDHVPVVLARAHHRRSGGYADGTGRVRSRACTQRQYAG